MKKRNIRLAVIVVMIGLLLGICSATLADGNSAEHNHSNDFSVFTLIKVLGVCALASLLITFLTGLFRRKLGRKFLSVHRFLAWLTIVLALSHGITVMIVF
jgi:hypothetical protein